MPEQYTPEELLAIWKSIGDPEIPLPHGGDIYDLERYLTHYAEVGDAEALAIPERYLLAGRDDDGR